MPYVVAQFESLGALHGSHNHRFFMVAEGSLSPINRSASVQRINDVIADGFRIVTNDVKALTPSIIRVATIALFPLGSAYITGLSRQ